MGHAKHAGNLCTCIHTCNVIARPQNLSAVSLSFLSPQAVCLLPAGNSRPRKRQRTMLVKKERRTYRTLASKFQQV